MWRKGSIFAIFKPSAVRSTALSLPADGDCHSYILLQLGQQRDAGRQRAQGRQSAQTVRVATGDQTNPARFRKGVKSDQLI